MDFWQQMRGALDRGVDTSRDLFNKAKDRAQDLSRSGILRFEKMQLEDQLQKELARLGHSVYDLLNEGNEPVTLESGDVRRIYEEISRLRESIQTKEREIGRAREAEGEPDA